MTDLPVCRLCGCDPAHYPLPSGEQKHHCATRECTLHCVLMTSEQWNALMGVGEPVAILCHESDEFRDTDWFMYQPIKPGSAIHQHRQQSKGWKTMPVYPHPAPAVDGAVLLDAERLDWISRNPDFSSSIVVDRMHDGEYEIFGDNCGPFYGETFRDALDAAMKGEG